MDDREREKAREREELEVERAVEEDLAKLNGAAMFFIKKGFSKVRTCRGVDGTACLSDALHHTCMHTSLTIQLPFF